MSDPGIRPAEIGDAADLHALLLARAGDIPLAIETLEQEEALYAELRKLLGWGESWVAEAGGRIVACVVVDNIQTGRHWGESETLDLRFAATDPAHQRTALLDTLIAKLLERRALILARVKGADTTGLAPRLERLGFVAAEERLGERHFRRET